MTQPLMPEQQQFPFSSVNALTMEQYFGVFRLAFCPLACHKSGKLLIATFIDNNKELHIVSFKMRIPSLRTVDVDFIGHTKQNSHNGDKASHSYSAIFITACTAQISLAGSCPI